MSTADEYVGITGTLKQILPLYLKTQSRDELEESLKKLSLTFPDGKPIQTHYFAKQFLKQHSPAGFPEVVEIDCCPKFHCLFRRQYADLLTCPLCDEERYDRKGNPVCTFPYIPLVPRIRRAYASTTFSAMFEKQFKRSVSNQGDKISDVYDGLLFKMISDKVGRSKYVHPYFIGIDGITMDTGKKKSVEPIALCDLFFPPDIRSKSENMLSVGCIPPGANNVMVFIQPLLEELSEPFQVFDGLDQKWHWCRPFLLFGSFDHRGMPKITRGNQSPAKFACHICEHRGVHHAPAATTVYPGHFTYLPHRMGNVDGVRTRSHSIMNNETKEFLSVDSDPPRKRTKRSVLQAAALADECPLPASYKKHPCKTHFQQDYPLFVD
jgi:hypothetical protein